MLKLDPSSRRRAYHAVVLALAIVAIVGAVTLRQTPGGRLAPLGEKSLALPTICPIRAGLGWNCPSCGLTRSVTAFAHGNFAGSWQFHKLGWLAALAIAAQAPYRLYALRQSAPNRRSRLV
jgi:hypothetical protein